MLWIFSPEKSDGFEEGGDKAVLNFGVMCFE
jgi:hypothetical protein